MYGTFDWAGDVVPEIAAFFGNGLVRGGLIAMIAIGIGSYAGRGLIGVFFKRD